MRIFSSMIFFVIMIFAFFVLIMFSTGMFGAMDESVNLTGTNYSDQYEFATDVTQVSLTTISFAPILLAGFAMIGALLIVFKIT